MVVWDVWQPALSTQSLHLDWTVTVLVWTTTLVFSNKYLKTTNKKLFLTLGWLTKTGWFAQAVATKCHLHTLHWHLLFTISMYLVTKLLLKTACVCLTWIQLILQSSKMVSTLTRQISLTTWLFSFTQTIATNKVNCSVSSNNTSWFQTVLNWSSMKQSKKEATCMTLLTTQLYKSMILTHQWWSLNWSVFWLNVVSNLMKQSLSFVAWLPTQTTQFLLKPLKNGLLNSWKKWFLTWYQSSKNWTVVFVLNTKIQLFKSLMNTIVYTWPTWISTMDTA